ncbi:MAG: substrate-binding domain-containing protein [Thermoplasmata archaeon]
MRPLARTGVTIAVAVLAVAAGFAGGWIARGAANGAVGPDRTLTLIAAGSLSPPDLLPAFASAWANRTPGVSAPLAAQSYTGSAAAAEQIVAAGNASPFDLFVSADFRVIPKLLAGAQPPAAAGEVVFGSDPLILAYDPAAMPNVSAANWPQALLGPGVVLGVPNASADPLGANVIFALELEDAAGGYGDALYSRFFTGTPGGFAGITAHARYVPETDAALALATGEVSAYITYASYARVDHLAYVPLPPSVNLGGTSEAWAAAYASASTTVLSGGAPVVERGAPALFALTVPVHAPDPSLGEAFAAWLLSAGEAPAWEANGFLLPPSPWAWGSVPYLPPGSAPLPPYLAALV